MDTTSITVEQAAESLGIGVYELGRYLRTEAGRVLSSLAGAVERGGESNRGDVDHDEYGDQMAAAWRLAESARACEDVWHREMGALTDE